MKNNFWEKLKKVIKRDGWYIMAYVIAAIMILQEVYK